MTVPGDPLLGFFAAAAATGGTMLWGRVPITLVIVMAIYWAGMILNDCFDLTQDWRAGCRDRPLVSGEITLDQAYVAALILSAFALLIAWLISGAVFVAALILLALAVTYDRFSKHHAMLGPFNMGLCRGGAVLLGVTAQAPETLLSGPTLTAAGGMTGYVLLVTLLARGEKQARRLGREVLLLPGYVAVLILASVISGSLFGSHIAGTAAGIVILLTVLTFMLYQGVEQYVQAAVQPPRVLRRLIGSSLRALIPLQAALISVFGGLSGTATGGVMLILLLPLSNHLKRYFYSS